MNIIPWANVVLLLRNVRWERERRIIIENVSLAQIALKIRLVNEDFLFFKFSLQLATLFNFSREVGGLGLLCLCCVSILSILMKPLRHFFSPGFTIFQVWNIVGNLEPGNSVPALFWRNSEKKTKIRRICWKNSNKSWTNLQCCTNILMSEKQTPQNSQKYLLFWCLLKWFIS